MFAAVILPEASASRADTDFLESFVQGRTMAARCRELRSGPDRKWTLPLLSHRALDAGQHLFRSPADLNQPRPLVLPAPRTCSLLEHSSIHISAAEYELWTMSSKKERNDASPARAACAGREPVLTSPPLQMLI